MLKFNLNFKENKFSPTNKNLLTNQANKFKLTNKKKNKFS